MSEEIKLGFYRQSLWDYISGPGVNRSYLHELLRSAGHGEYKQGHPDDTKSLRVGDATHAAVLEPERFKKEYIILPANCMKGTKQNPNKGMATNLALFDARCEVNNQTIITMKDSDNIREMAAVIHAEQKAMDLLCNGEAELSGYFMDPDYEILVKIRLDYINKKDTIVTDLKTAKDARHRSFRASAFTYGYDLQAYMGLYGLTQITGETHDEFRFIVIESEGYHGLKIYRADEEMLNIGFKKYHESMQIYKQSIESGVWNGYNAECEDLGTPDYAKESVTAAIYD